MLHESINICRYIWTTAFTSNYNNKDLLHDFNIGIKHNQTAYIASKEDNKWDTWHICVMAQAGTLVISEILDNKHNPSNNAEK